MDSNEGQSLGDAPTPEAAAREAVWGYLKDYPDCSLTWTESAYIAQLAVEAWKQRIQGDVLKMADGIAEEILALTSERDTALADRDRARDAKQALFEELAVKDEALAEVGRMADEALSGLGAVRTIDQSIRFEDSLHNIARILFLLNVRISNAEREYDEPPMSGSGVLDGDDQMAVVHDAD